VRLSDRLDPRTVMQRMLDEGVATRRASCACISSRPGPRP